jgi:hypothetical protein
VLLDDIVIVPGKPVVINGEPVGDPVVIHEAPRSAPIASLRTGYLAKDPSDWTWSDLRDYVIFEIEQRQGPQDRNIIKESGIFKSFFARWGDRAPRIAKTVFDIHDGYWQGKPVTVNRFCKNSDPYFSEVITARW